MTQTPSTNQMGESEPGPPVVVDYDPDGTLARADQLVQGIETTLEKLPAPAARLTRWLLARWPGRIAIGTAQTCIRIELFDRSMTIAAQLFTSVFPILIALASWFKPDLDQFTETTGIADAAQDVVAEAFAAPSNATFGLVGAFIVLVSATSLSRALTRAFSAIWGLPRPKTRLGAAWRWFAVVLGLAISLVAARQVMQYAEEIPPGQFWSVVVGIVCDVAVFVVVPWILLAGVLRVRHLMTGALIYATAMAFIRPASAVFLPQALQTSASRYGSIGVAFTYLAWLYAIAWVLLLAGVLGAVIVKDRGTVGTWLRGSVEPGSPVPPKTPPAAEEAPVAEETPTP